MILGQKSSQIKHVFNHTYRGDSIEEKRITYVALLVLVAALPFSAGAQVLPSLFR